MQKLNKFSAKRIFILLWAIFVAGLIVATYIRAGASPKQYDHASFVSREASDNV